MRKVLNFILLWLVLFLAFQTFACKSVQKNVKEEPGKAAVTKPQTNTMETGKAMAKAGSTETSKKKAGSNQTSQKKTGSNQTSQKKTGSNETGKDKQGTLTELKEKMITEAEEIISPQIRKAILPSGVGLLILISLMSSKKEKTRKSNQHRSV